MKSGEWINAGCVYNFASIELRNRSLTKSDKKKTQTHTYVVRGVKQREAENCLRDQIGPVSHIFVCQCEDTINQLNWNIFCLLSH